MIETLKTVKISRFFKISKTTKKNFKFQVLLKTPIFDLYQLFEYRNFWFDSNRHFESAMIIFR